MQISTFTKENKKKRGDKKGRYGIKKEGGLGLSYKLDKYS